MLVRFDAQVVVPLAEVKLIETSEPLVIIGSDLMAPPTVQKGWRFKYIGYNDPDVGTIRFRRANRTRTVQLLAWPTVRPEMSVPRTYVQNPAQPKAPKHAQRTSAKPAPVSKAPAAVPAAPTTRQAAILALIRNNRGQRL